MLPGSYEATLVAYDAVVVRRKEARDTPERWFGMRKKNHLKLGSHLVGLECGYPVLLRLGRLNTCLSQCLLGISLVVVLQYLLEALEKENAREVRHPVPLLHQRDLNLTTSQLFSQKEEGCISKIQASNVL